MSHRDSAVPDRESSRELTDAWVRASGHVLNSVVEANRAALAAFGLADERSNGDRSKTERSNGDRHDSASETETRSDSDWSVERTVESVDELGVGDRVTFTKTLDDEDVLAFARASGDTNPLHLSDEFAEQTRFGRRIVHGTLVSGVVSAALARLPGEVIYLSQETEYLAPAEPGEAVTAEVEVTEALGESRYRLSTVATAGGDDRRILEGEAVVLVDDPPEGD